MLVTISLNCLFLLGTNLHNASYTVRESRVIQRIPTVIQREPTCFFFESTQLHVSSEGDVYALVSYCQERNVRCHLHTRRDGKWSETSVSLAGDPLPLVHAAMEDDRYYLYTFSSTKLSVYGTLDDILQDNFLWRADTRQGAGGDLVPLSVDQGHVLLLSHQDGLVLDPIAWVMGVVSGGHSGYASRICSVLIENARFRNVRWRPGALENLKSEDRAEWLLEDDHLHLTWDRDKTGCFYATINVGNNSWEDPILIAKGTCSCPSLGRYGESIYCAWYHYDTGRIHVAKISGNIVVLLNNEQHGFAPRLVNAGDGKLVLFWLDEQGINYQRYTEDGQGPVCCLTEFADANVIKRGRDTERFFHVVSDKSGNIHILTAGRYGTMNDALTGSEAGWEVLYTSMSGDALQTAPR